MLGDADVVAGHLRGLQNETRVLVRATDHSTEA